MPFFVMCVRLDIMPNETKPWDFVFLIMLLLELPMLWSNLSLNEWPLLILMFTMEMEPRIFFSMMSVSYTAQPFSTPSILLVVPTPSQNTSLIFPYQHRLLEQYTVKP